MKTMVSDYFAHDTMKHTECLTYSSMFFWYRPPDSASYYSSRVDKGAKWPYLKRTMKKDTKEMTINTISLYASKRGPISTTRPILSLKWPTSLQSRPLLAQAVSSDIMLLNGLSRAVSRIIDWDCNPGAARRSFPGLSCILRRSFQWQAYSPWDLQVSVTLSNKIRCSGVLCPISNIELGIGGIYRCRS